MRIVHVIASLDPAAGGPPVVATRLAAAQAARLRGGLERVAVVAHAGPGQEQAVRGAWASVPHFSGVTLELVPLTGRAEALRASAAAAVLDRAIEPCAKVVVHLHGVWEPLIRRAAAVARRRGVPYVLTPHGMLDPYSLRQKAWKKKLALLLGYRDMLRRAAFLHTLNDDEARLIGPLNLGTPCVTIGNGIFPEEVEPLPPAGTFRARHPELGDGPYILFLSRLHHKKGLDHLADAFAELSKRRPELRLVVAGPDGGERAPFEARVRAAGVAERVHVVGPLYGPDKLAALVDAAVFCLPSRQEGFSVAVTEAMACGCPVVISTECHFPEVAVAGAGFVVALDPRAVADALGRVLADPAAARVMGAAGRGLVLSRFTWPQIADQMLAAYERVQGSGFGVR